jgi:hypothetical protein
MTLGLIVDQLVLGMIPSFRFTNFVNRSRYPGGLSPGLNPLRTRCGQP